MNRKLILSAALAALLSTSALAQQFPGVNTVNQAGLNIGNTRYSTFSATSVALVPAASATDIFCVGASASRNVMITNIGVSGTAGTAITAPIVILRRATLDTGGTLATGNAAPAANNEVGGQAVGTAGLVAYTANPTITDSSPAILRAGVLALPTSAAAVAQTAVYPFGTLAGEFNTELTLQKGTTQQACVNLNATSISSGVLYVWAEWQEY